MIYINACSVRLLQPMLRAYVELSGLLQRWNVGRLSTIMLVSVRVNS